MGQLNSLAEINPLTAVTNAIKSVVHDCSLYVCNAAVLDSDCCACWRFKVQTFETGEPEPEKSEAQSDSHAINVAWH